ncbi:hypothetical protein CEUSTIGMA_g7371.t1 [Chlamydomonas eustigma]|uniref:Uncharacterized protein n=1 Tax=Chlamydomonas eustigma TaxID=1157962 RepID=A0A250XA09_9CHLO|nr:hypothetical protein CEUSTIGMA_g7371.t1 [Chlamydomonas eustigma]|eukprot:GAX79931.1 hypothetical protein CEUSTIGMA_g7371.t1 [Chlamydomonas eustigma]
MARREQSETALEPLIRAAYPFLVSVYRTVDEAWPYVEKVYTFGEKGWKILEPHQDSVMALVFGAILILFGGSLPLTIAAVEAFRLFGWEKSKGSLKILWEQYKIAKAASEKDDLHDDNNDGIPDVRQINAKELLSRKAGVFLKVTDPVKLQEALAGIMAGATAVIATLRLEFVQTITLGVSLADMFTKTADKFIRPTLEKLVPLEYHKWIPMLISYSCRGVAVHIAWWCQRIISAIHSALRGSDMLLRGVFAVLNKYHINIPMRLTTSHDAFPAAVMVLGVIGFYSQLGRGFGFPFPFNILLIPLRILEFFLSWTLAK